MYIYYNKDIASKINDFVKMHIENNRIWRISEK